MVTDEEILAQIEQKKQEIVTARNELQNRIEVRQMPKTETITQRVFRMFNNFIKPNQKPSYSPLGQNNYDAIPNKEVELEYFKKLLRKKDIEIRKQKYMITKMNAPKRYIKKDFMEGSGIINKRTTSIRQLPRESVEDRARTTEWTAPPIEFESVKVRPLEAWLR